MRRQASAQATVQEVSGAKASAREATGRAYACTEHVPQRSPLGGLVRENDGVAHDVVSRGRHFAPNWRPFGVQQRLTPSSTEKKGCPEPAPLGGVGGEQWRAHSGLRSPPDGQKIGLWGSLNQVRGPARGRGGNGTAYSGCFCYHPLEIPGVFRTSSLVRWSYNNIVTLRRVADWS